jgi:hypothetical protein
MMNWAIIPRIGTVSGREGPGRVEVASFEGIVAIKRELYTLISTA